MSAALDRRLGLTGSTAVGVSAMIGAGLFVVWGPAVEAAGDGLLVALALAAVVAACNAGSSARLAALYPVSGGTYVYGRERLGPFWGHLAGWSFVAGKLASCAVMALAVGTYVAPDHARLVAVAAIGVVTAVNVLGVEKSAVVGIVLTSVVLAVVTAALVAMWSAGGAASADLPTEPRGVLNAAGVLFFAFAGYARLATLGEEVRQPSRTIPRAIAVAVVLVVAVYAASAGALLHVLGAPALAAVERPFVAGVEAAGADPLVACVVAATTLAAGGALLSLTLGVSRTMFAMARDRHLPRQLTLVGPRHRVPWVAEVAVAAIVTAIVLAGDLATGVAFSSFCVLTYYAVTNAAALTLPSGIALRVVPVAGLVGCLALACSLPLSTVAVGAGVLAAGAVSFVARRRRDRRDSFTA